MQKILITGGSGLVGSRLTEMLLEKGYDVVHLSRTKKEGRVKSFVWDVPKRHIDAEAFTGVDAIIHLAGAGVAEEPWTPRRKQEILESRTHSSRLLYDYLKNNNTGIKTFVSASAIGYYGFDASAKTVFRESDSPGSDFLADVVKKWEAEVSEISSLKIRVVMVRVGIVLSKDSGALFEMSKPVKYYVGAPLGTGEQMLSWIHVDDLCRIFIKAVEEGSMNGPVNGVGPYPVTNRQLTKAIAKKLNRPLIFPPIPAFVLKMLLGEMADLALKGNAVSNEKLISTGFQYKFDTVEKALDDLL
jgi:uncharacterized protein